MKETTNSLYIHLPFCKQKCNYCDFVSYAGKEALIDEYVDALCRELATRDSRPATRDPRLEVFVKLIVLINNGIIPFPQKRKYLGFGPGHVLFVL